MNKYAREREGAGREKEGREYEIIRDKRPRERASKSGENMRRKKEENKRRRKA